MKRSIATTCVAIAVLTLLIAGWWQWRKKVIYHSASPQDSIHEANSPPGSSSSSFQSQDFSQPAAAHDEPKGANDFPDNWTAWIEWKEAWDASGDRAGFARALVAFLEQEIDFESGETFRVGPSGNLRSAPSARVAALDWLGNTDPQAASILARKIFERSDNPAEWAVALRNYGRQSSDLTRDTYFEAHVRAFINNRDWGRTPTAGFLEGFDAGVAGRTLNVVNDLAVLFVEAENPSTRAAALIALSNIGRRDAMLLANTINVSDSVLVQAPIQRATLLGDLDPREPRHIAEITHYLSEVASTAEEIQAFINTFPNANGYAAHYLLTEPAPRNLREQAQIDLAAYRLVRQWKEQGFLENHRESLTELETRLSAYVESAIRGGILPPETAID